jgi:cytochrome c
MLRALSLTFFVMLLAAQPARTEEAIEARQGRALAQRECAPCHGVVPGAPSPAAGAPNFTTVAMAPGMSPIALRVALQTPHHSMPNLMLSPDEMRDITAYIMSLRPPN